MKRQCGQFLWGQDIGRWGQRVCISNTQQRPRGCCWSADHTQSRRPPPCNKGHRLTDRTYFVNREWSHTVPQNPKGMEGEASLVGLIPWAHGHQHWPWTKVNGLILPKRVWERTHYHFSWTPRHHLLAFLNPCPYDTFSIRLVPARKDLSSFIPCVLYGKK